MFDSSVWDRDLDDTQLAVATHGHGPLVVVAGAGTGKTRALTARVACLLERGVAAERVLLLTFTRRAADEMLARAARLVDLAGGRRPTGGTFHAVAHRYIAAHAESVGFSAGFTILDPAEARDLMDLMRGEHGLSGNDVRFPTAATLVEAYSRCINTSKTLHEVVRLEYPWCEPYTDAMADLFRAFTARKRRASLLDFDDLLLYWRALLDDVDLGPRLAGSFDYVLVDEYQDVNSLQVDIVRRLAPDGRGLTVVGDEAQAVYGFRGSNARHLRQVVTDLPGATVIRLERNFRSKQAILALANAVRPNNTGPEIHLFSGRGTGARPRLVRCHDASAEATNIVDAVLESHDAGVALKEQAVLVRAGHHSDLVELELSARHVPYRKYGGLRFLEAAHVKDFVTAARLLDNCRDELAWFRILRLHPKIGPSRARALTDAVGSWSGDALECWPELVALAPAPTRARLSTTLEGLARARTGDTPGGRADAVFQAIRPLVVERYPDSPARLADLERLVGAASAATDLAAWLAELTLDPPASTGDLAGPPHMDEDYVVISTIHSAKGLEWSVVHVPHVIDGFIPIDMALGSPEGLEEEERLFYVAVTRARDELHLYAPLRLPYRRRARDDKHGYAPMSRFLRPEVRSALDVCERVPPRCAAEATGRSPITVELDDLWS